MADPQEDRDRSEDEPCVCAGYESTCRGDCPLLRRRDAEDAARWRMLPAFIEEHQIDYMRLSRQIDEAMAGRTIGLSRTEGEPTPPRGNDGGEQ